MYAVKRVDPRLPAEKHSTYYDGEYVVLRETPHAVLVVKPVAGYGGHQTQSFPKAQWDFDTPQEDTKALRELEQELREFSTQTGQWVGSVYAGARSVADQISRILRDRTDECDCGDESKIIVTFEDGREVTLAGLRHVVAVRVA